MSFVLFFPYCKITLPDRDVYMYQMNEGRDQYIFLRSMKYLRVPQKAESEVKSNGQEVHGEYSQGKLLGVR